MRRIQHCALLTLFLITAPLLLQAESSKSATKPSEIDPHSARGALKAYADELPAGGMKAAGAAYHATDAKEKTLAKALARTDLAAAKVEHFARDKFGKKSADAVVHAMRLPTETDMADATEKVEGDKATIEWADGRESLVMVKVNGKWKIAVADLIDPDDKDNDSAKEDTEVAEALEQLLKKCEAGEFANATLLERAIKQKMFKILGEDEADN